MLLCALDLYKVVLFLALDLYKVVLFWVLYMQIGWCSRSWACLRRAFGTEPP